MNLAKKAHKALIENPNIKKITEQQKQIDDLNAQLANAFTTDSQGYYTTGGGVNDYGIEKSKYITMRDAEGNLNDRFREDLNPTLQGMLDKYSVEGDTTWAALQRQMLENQGNTAKGDARKQALTGMAQARSGLAMRGGLRAGAGERMAMGNQRALMSNIQNIGAQTRDQNLQLSLADEEMKNQVLGQIGGEQQAILGRNIGRLQGDIQGQNTFNAQRYSDDMTAYGAKETAAAQRKAACFVPFTMVRLINGTEVPIVTIKIGDKLAEGGKVYSVLQALCDDLHWYKDVKVAGSHAVREEGKWIRVRDSKHSKPIKGEHVVYNLGVDNHIIIAEGHIFSDLHETDYYEDLTEAQSLEVLNGKNINSILR